MRRLIIVAAASLAGCGASGLSIADGADMAVSVDLAMTDSADLAVTGPADLAVRADLAMTGPADLAVRADLAMTGPADLAVRADLALPQTPACMPAGGPIRAQYVWSNVLVPMNRMEYAFDLNGDGRVDDQLGNIEGALAGQNFDVQGQTTQAVTSGQSLTLVDEHADDLANDDCAASDVVAAMAMAAPDFSGAGHFTIDATAQVGRFAGPIVSGKFSSAPLPPYAATPVLLTLELPLLGAVTPLDIVGAHVQYTRGADGRVTGGQLNGAIRKSDVDGKLVPNVAAALTAQVQANPGNSSSHRILAIFDNGGRADPGCSSGTCQNPNGSCAIKADGKIDTCEVATSGLIQNLLAPDVQLFDAAGHYRPNPDNTNKDCLSIGLGFTAVPASF